MSNSQIIYHMLLKFFPSTKLFPVRNILSLLLLFCYSLISCSSHEYDNENIPIVYHLNNSLPSGDTLRILAIGNSYTEDATAYLNDIVSESNIDRNKLGVYVAAIGGASLQTWAETYETGNEVRLTQKAGNIIMKNKGSLKELLAQNWDIITLQQVSTQSTDFKTFNPWLSKLLTYIEKDCPNPEVTLAWQMAWSYWTGYGRIPYGEMRYKMICEAVKEQIKENGIDIIIPIGTALENARSTSLQTPHALTRDGTHLSFGAGRYIAACTWYESLIAPVFGETILYNTATHVVTQKEKDASKYETVDVNETNSLLCQLCAIYAIKQPFKPTTPKEQT